LIKSELLSHDPDRWGHSLGNAAELLFPLLDVVGAKSILEIGAYAGDLTTELVDWANHNDAEVVAIDPGPHYDLLALAHRTLCLEMVREKSHDALRHVAVPDVAIVDGDHNYYTVSGELRILAERSEGRPPPMFILHDVGWPHARRDTYFEPDDIPEEYRQPIVEGAHLVPEERGTTDKGLLYHWAAAEEGGARNGVLTAAEDFVADHPGLRLAVIPVFFGIGVIWSEDEPWAEAVADFLGPWDRNPVLEWLEANRVFNLARKCVRVAEAGMLAERVEELEYRQEKLIEHHRAVLGSLLESRAFASADRIWRLRHPGHASESWREKLRAELGEDSSG
jgi:methyltransferase family protein